MKKMLLVSLFILFQVQFVYAKYNSERSVEASRIWNEIDDLEKEKPLLRAVISYVDNQLPIAKTMKSDVEQYAQKVTVAYKSNAIKTVISGSLSLASETAGGISGKSFVDLGLWLTNKGISVAMGDSSTFGGVSSYKRSISDFLLMHKTLTKELNKLNTVAKTSDTAIKSYYNKYGKYRDLFGQLGDVGVFTTRMRLIIEQSTPAIASLKNLIDRLVEEKKSTKLRLKQVDKKIKRLKDKLKELDKKQKSKETKPFKPKLSDKEKVKGNIKHISPSIIIDNSKNCKTISRRIATLRSRYRAIIKTQNEQVKKLNSLRKSYLDDLDEKRKEINSMFHKALQNVPLPTGYEKPMSKILSVTQVWFNAEMRADESMTASLKKMAKHMVADIPGDKLAKKVSQTIANSNYIYKSGLGLVFELESGGCSGDDVGIDKLMTIKFNAGNEAIVPVVNYPDMIRDRKKKLMIIINNREKTDKLMKSYYAKVLTEMKLNFQEKRKQMREAIDKYEKSIKKNETFEDNLMADMISLQNLYSSKLFIAKEKKWGKNYHLNIEIKDSDTACQAIKKIRTILNSPNVQNVISLKNKIKLNLGFLSMYSALPIPKAAFEEFGKNIKNAINSHATHRDNFTRALNVYRDNSSDAQFLYNSFSQNEFFRVPQFRPLYDKLVDNSNLIRMLIRNLRTEIENALSSKIVPRQEYAHLSDFYKNLIKKFKKDLSCIPITHKILAGIVEDLADLKKLLPRVGSKPTYKNMSVMITNVKQLLSSVENLSFENTKTYKNRYKKYLATYGDYDKKINETYREKIDPTDREKINDMLSTIRTILSSYANNTENLNEGGDMQPIRDFYRQFKEAYESKDVSSVTSLLSNDWSSSADGVDISDLEDYLGRSFRLFDSITYNISNLNIQKIQKNLYRASYNLSIEGEIYDDDIEHVEKSSVQEEVQITNGRVKILKTLNGHYWSIK